jgi:SET domain-containing protein
LTLVANTPKGRGVFASERIPARTVIEVCPVLILDPKDAGNHISKTMLDHYTYNWPWKHGMKTQVVVLGLGSMFNHSTYAQNVAWTRDVPNECITYVALNDIEIGDEFHDTDAEVMNTVEEDISALNGLERIETS